MTLDGLRRLDDRLAAHLDGVWIAARKGWQVGEVGESPEPGSIFMATINAVEGRDEAGLAALIDHSQAHVDARRALVAACGWMEKATLQGVVVHLLRDRAAFARMLGIAACAVHRVDPGLMTAGYLRDPAVPPRARALRAAGELGHAELLPACVAALDEDDPEIAFWAAWSAVLLGNRGRAVRALLDVASNPGDRRMRAFDLALLVLPTAEAHGVLQSWAKDGQHTTNLIRGSWLAGDPAYVPWLIARMATLETARLAGEAFTLITGADLDSLQLYQARPEDDEDERSEDPADTNVDVDPSEGMPWPDPAKVETWWAGNSHRFQNGTRYFRGAPVTREHCLDVLRNGYQRQRILAAQHLCLLNPGTPLFNTGAPAWRQQKLLARMD
jgi:uncharacterized protein (TIGR02270 family)